MIEPSGHTGLLSSKKNFCVNIYSMLTVSRDIFAFIFVFFCNGLKFSTHLYLHWQEGSHVRTYLPIFSRHFYPPTNLPNTVHMQVYYIFSRHPSHTIPLIFKLKVFFLKWAKLSLFCLFSLLSHDKYRANLTINDKSVEGVLGT